MINRLPLTLLFATALIVLPGMSLAQTPSTPAVSTSQADSSSNVDVSPASFDASATVALQAMKARADELKIGGAAVLAYFEGDKIQSWTSKMLVVNRVKDEPTATDKGSNLLAIAYAKAAEMADTLKDSGSGVRPPMTGEFGWQGGVIVRVKNGYVIAAFSGGKSEDDVAVSRAGAAAVINELRKSL